MCCKSSTKIWIDYVNRKLKYEKKLSFLQDVLRIAIPVMLSDVSPKRFIASDQ